VIETHQGTGTFIAAREVRQSDGERQRKLNQLVGDFIARAGADGFTVHDVVERLTELYIEKGEK
jgi:DNA-binding transcriptional regulator YhcF (GntR family)